MFSDNKNSRVEHFGAKSGVLKSELKTEIYLYSSQSLQARNDRKKEYLGRSVQWALNLFYEKA